MERSLTLRLPSPRSATIATLIVFAVAVGLWAGIRFGAAMLADPTGDVIASNELHEVHMANGAVFIGRITSRGLDSLRLDQPAILRQAPAAEAESGDMFVQALFADPYDLSGSLAISKDQVVAIGSVDVESTLGQAYRQATAGEATSSPSPGSP